MYLKKIRTVFNYFEKKLLFFFFCAFELDYALSVYPTEPPHGINKFQVIVLGRMLWKRLQGVTAKSVHLY